jgi:DNA-binding MarR family transcriptional regulator
MSSASSSGSDRAALVAALDRLQQQISGQSIHFGAAVAERVGMHPSDLEALGLLMDEGPTTAGRMAELTGLTTGAVTRMIDRLERGGYVRRELDPTDRRRVYVHVNAERLGELNRYYGSMSRAAHSLYEQFSDEQLGVILEFMNRALAIGVEQTALLRSELDEPNAASDSA